jgi:hypothetical protein
MSKDDLRFETIHAEGHGYFRETRILRDRRTGVCYLFHGNTSGGGLTPLLGQGGKPVVSGR